MRSKTFYDKDGSPYLTRATLLNLGPLGRIALHTFHRPDNDEHMHDHPWYFLSLVVSGWYMEERPDPKGSYNTVWRIRNKWSLGFRRPTDAHRIVQISLQEPCRTLLWISPDTGRRWGFHTENGWRFWRDYLTERGTPP